MMKISPSMKIGLGILLLMVAYFGVRSLFRAPVEEIAEIESPLFTVLVEDLAPQQWNEMIHVRGRTKALKNVQVRAQTNGQVVETPVEPGQPVSKGDLLCKLAVEDRKARLAEAEAAYRKATLDHNASVELAKEGYRSDTAVATQKAALDLAEANVSRAREELTRINITAPFDGIFDRRLAEIGDYLRNGDPCGVVISPSPMLVVGNLSEQEVQLVKPGATGRARLINGHVTDGSVRFVASTADPVTRTFPVELQIPNEDGTIKDGITAQFSISAGAHTVHIIPRSALTLNDDGLLSLRLIGDDHIVEERTISQAGETAAGLVVANLGGTITLITRGQDYVTPGQKVAIAYPASDDASTDEKPPSEAIQ